MAAALLGVMHLMPEWSQGTMPFRLMRLLVVVVAGVVAYFATLLVLGFRVKRVCPSHSVSHCDGKRKPASLRRSGFFYDVRRSAAMRRAFSSRRIARANCPADDGEGDHSVPAGQHVQLAAQHRPQRHPDKDHGEQQSVQAATGLRLQAVNQVLMCPPGLTAGRDRSQ